MTSTKREPALERSSSKCSRHNLIDDYCLTVPGLSLPVACLYNQATLEMGLK